MASIKTEFDFDRICRICLMEKPDLSLIFEQCYALEEILLPQILTECTIYKVERFDKFPDKMCQECIKSAHAAFTFKRQTERSYRMLLEQMKKGVAVVKGEPGLANGEKQEKRIRDRGTQTDHSALKEIRGSMEGINASGSRGNKSSLDMEMKKCKACGESFENIKLLRAHMMLAHPYFEKQCPICQRHFSRKEHMLRHLKYIHKQQGYKYKEFFLNA